MMKTIERAFLLGCIAVLCMASGAEAARFQKYLNATSCPGPGLCNIDFDNVPASKTLEISNVSCYVRFENSQAGLYAMQLLQISTSGGILNAVTLDPRRTDSGTPTGQNFSHIRSANHTIYAYATAGQHFRAFAQLMNANGRITQFACHISGQLLP